MQKAQIVRSGTLYLNVNSALMTVLVLAGVALGVTQVATGERPRFSDRIDTVIVIVLGGMTLVLVCGNAVFIRRLSRTVSQQRGRVRCSEQLEILGALVPWIGNFFYEHLLRSLQKKDQRATARAAGSVSLHHPKDPRR